MTAFEPGASPRAPRLRLLESEKGDGCSERRYDQPECFARYEQGKRFVHCFGMCGLTALRAKRDPKGPRVDDGAQPRTLAPTVASPERGPTGPHPTDQPKNGADGTCTLLRPRILEADSTAPHGQSAENASPSNGSVTQVEATHGGTRPTSVAESDTLDGAPEVWPWPAPLAPEVYRHSIAGAWASYLDEQQITEADPAAVLMQTLTALGGMIGLNPRLEHGNLIVPSKWFTLVVGDSALGRKGTAWDCASELLNEVDELFMRDRVLSGFGSGEALIKPVADGDDPAVEPDRRLLVLQTEFATVLRVAERPSSTLSPNLRDLYDMGPVRNLTKGETLTASRHHVALIGHITPTELRHSMKGTALSNGFGSRLLMVASRRSRLISRPASVDTSVLTGLAGQLRDVVEAARGLDAVGMTDEALDRWDRLYPEIENRQLPPVAAALTHRASPLTLRVALLHALLAGRSNIDATDLDVAAELVRYGTDTALHVFGDRLSDERAETLLEATRRAGAEGLTGRQRAQLFSNNLDASALNELMDSLVSVGLCAVVSPQRQGGGRPSKVFVAAEHAGAAALLYGEPQSR